MAGRDYDRETQDVAGHKYAYGFDLDVMHPFLLRAFTPFFKAGRALEVGSFRGDFTRRLLGPFDEVTCIEPSAAAAQAARERVGSKVHIVNAPCEQALLSGTFANVFVVHVLEHVDDPVAMLRRINDEWLAGDGRLFLACPNAHAPSRQIAVKMGLIAHETAVTPAEAEHGHRRTYTLDTLERDARAAGLTVCHRSGVFFKALANFQWDRLLGTDIISEEYLEGCYQLGQVYPELCSTIFLVCAKG
jgi:SAM-dependent methyltransferase